MGLIAVVVAIVCFVKSILFPLVTGRFAALSYAKLDGTAIFSWTVLFALQAC